MVISCGRLGGRWFDSAGRFFLLENLLFFGASGRAARDFGPPERAIDGYIPMGPKNIPEHQKSRFWR